ncbi:hypothetical protein ACWD25_28610 [Streptomyces sp. NPDC002920]
MDEEVTVEIDPGTYAIVRGLRQAASEIGRILDGAHAAIGIPTR